MAIYTKRGDKGETSMFDEDSVQRGRIPKDSLRVEALGVIDELNSFLGIIRSETQDKSLSLSIKEIQENLLTIGSITAGSKLKFFFAQTKKLERLIDGLEGELPVLRNFVVPGGSIVAAQLQYSRALTRRVERRVVALAKLEKVRSQILIYLNRLSDYLFMLAREVNHKNGVGDEPWKGKK